VGQPLDIAVIGSGISGLSAAWLLSKRHKVTIYERETSAGGHSNTVSLALPDGPCTVDTGFIVYNTATYPNLIALLGHLGVATAPTRMSFAVSLAGGTYEYKGSAAGLFGQPRNLASARHWRMIGDVLRFYREAKRASGRLSRHLGLGDFLSDGGYSEGFVRDHILPMAAAIWSAPDAEILDFPASSFFRFFANHGLLELYGRPQWRTVVGGSRRYVDAMLRDIATSSGGASTRLAEPVSRVRRTPAGAYVTTGDGTERRFDAAVIATHADEALALLADPSPLERKLLGVFRYARNEAVLHEDASLMPKRRRLWASWNYIGQRRDPAEVQRRRPQSELCATYWMNSLQPLATRRDLFVTLNPPRPPRADLVHRRFTYHHPLFDARAIGTQSELWSLQGDRRSWFAGSYFGHGFHEDGLQAGLAVAEQLGGGRRPWRVAGESGRIHLRDTSTGPSPLAAEAAA
jgi:hypothetical protein